jgi:hypothetical protein
MIKSNPTGQVRFQSCTYRLRPNPLGCIFFLRVVNVIQPVFYWQLRSHQWQGNLGTILYTSAFLPDRSFLELSYLERLSEMNINSRIYDPLPIQIWIQLQILLSCALELSEEFQQQAI